jgi:dihydrofolate reductase
VRRIVLMMSVSLDGFMEGPDRDISWHAVDEELHGHFNEVLGAMSAFLDGRVTYEGMAEFWPTADADPGGSESIAEFARIWREMPKFVYSRTLERAGWNTTVVRAVVPEEVRALQAQPGGDMAVGGADLAATFLAYDLIDEFRLYVNPVVLGSGRRLFPPGDAPVQLQLVETRTFGNGVVLLRYRRPAR